MNAQINDGNETTAPSNARVPHLSHSRISKYLHCPEQYRLYYVEGLQLKIPDASLVFGQVIHKSLEHLFRTGEDPIAFFREAWSGQEHAELAYKDRESWAILRDKGVALLELFQTKHLQRITNVRAIEQSFELNVTSLDEPFVGIVDLIADLDGVPTLIDFKTAASSYAPHEVVLSDQLTAYWLSEPNVDQIAFCVLVKTKEPKIEWHVARREPVQLDEYLDKVEYVAGEIGARRFFKRPGKWCGYCDFLSVCTGGS